MGAAASVPGEQDALTDLLQRKGDRVTGSSAGDTKMIIEGALASYALKHQLGDGGYGVVWKAIVLEGSPSRKVMDLKMGDPVAVKILNDIDHTEEFLGQCETENMQACIHPNILRLYEHCMDGTGNHCLIMEFAAGGTLEDYLIDLDDHLPEKEACRIFIQMLDALKCIHSSEIIHCDLKPSNFMLGAATSLKVIDFGCSCKKEAGREPRTKARGSPIYSSPEQIDLEEFDESTDLWSLGVILHEMLTGNLPEDVYEIVRRNRELPEPRKMQFKDCAWNLIKGLVASRKKRISEVRSAQELAEEWSQDMEYGEESFCDDTLHDGVLEQEAEDEGYDDAEFDACSSEDET